MARLSQEYLFLGDQAIVFKGLCQYRLYSKYLEGVTSACSPGEKKKPTILFVMSYS